jgi:hypothetical protein
MQHRRRGLPRLGTAGELLNKSRGIGFGDSLVLEFSDYILDEADHTHVRLISMKSCFVVLET